MNKLFLALTFVSMSTVGFASEYVYNCKSETDLKVFNIGHSKEITIELNSGYLSINNQSGIHNNLVQVDKLDGTIYFKSAAQMPTPETADLVGIADEGLTKGAAAGDLVVVKGIQTTPVMQEYMCDLSLERN